MASSKSRPIDRDELIRRLLAEQQATAEAANRMVVAVGTGIAFALDALTVDAPLTARPLAMATLLEQLDDLEELKRTTQAWVDAAKRAAAADQRRTGRES